MAEQSKALKWSIACVVAAVILTTSASAFGQATPQELPPRPTAVPTATPTTVPTATLTPIPTVAPTALPTVQAPPAPSPALATIALRLTVAPEPVMASGWQALWTVVQWQDGLGAWHDVDGWRGGFDWVGGSEGLKVWAVEAKDFGTGPFRWLVYERATGRQATSSTSFYLPRLEGETVKLEVTVQ